MTAPAPFPPPGRVLSAWRDQLAAFRPPCLRFARLLLHRVEALVRVAGSRRLDPFDAALLGQFAEGAAADRLRLDGGALAGLARGLAADGLLEWGPGGPRLTEKGRTALASGAYPSPAEERRTFIFASGAGARPPAFLALHGPAFALPPPPGWHFDPAALEACVRRPPEWKARHGFPAEVEAVAPAAGPPATAADWRRVVLDRPEQILIVFIPSDDPARPGWLGYAARPDAGALQTSSAAVVLAAEDGGPEALPELAEEPPPEAWRGAWRAWCAGRGVPAAEADACRLEAGPARVRALPPPATAGRLGDASGEWLAAAAGRTFAAAPLEIREDV